MAVVDDPKAASDVTVYSVYTDLKVMRDIAKTCVRCDLAKTRTQVVFGDGPYVPPGQIGIMMMGEAPGEDEDKQGKPFVGRSGKLLNTLLEQAGLKRDTIWVTNTNKCRPVLIEGKSVKNRAPTPPEQKACEIWWQNEIDLLKPQIVLCLGATAAKKILDNKGFMITKDRGKWFQGPKKYRGVGFLPPFLRDAPAGRGIYGYQGNGCRGFSRGGAAVGSFAGRERPLAALAKEQQTR